MPRASEAVHERTIAPGTGGNVQIAGRWDDTGRSGRVRVVRHPLHRTVSHPAGESNAYSQRPRRFVHLVTVLGLAGATLLAACGGVAEAPPEPKAQSVELKVMPPKWRPKQQVSGDETYFSMTITNTGDTVAPDVIVNLQGLTDRVLRPREEEDEGLQAFEDEPPANEPGDAAENSKVVDRAAWIVDAAPGGGALAGSDNYTGGRLEPGRTITMRWRLGAVRPGTFTLGWRVFAGLSNGQAKATRGSGLTGEITQTITDREPEDTLAN